MLFPERGRQVRRNTLTIGEFAARGAVTVRTVRYYDQVRLLAPAAVSEGGQRLYTEAQLVQLQQILALKLLGFSLAEIRRCLAAGPQDFLRSLAGQKAMLAEKRSQLDAVIRAIEAVEQSTGAEDAAGDGEAWTWESLTKLLEVMHVEQKGEWVNKYFTPEQQAAMADLSRQSYSDAAHARIGEWGAGWSEEDQRRIDAQYAALAGGLKEAVAEGKSAGSAEVQKLAADFLQLIGQFTRGDAEVQAGLADFWQNNANLPAQQQIPMPWGAAEQALLDEAVKLQRAG